MPKSVLDELFELKKSTQEYTEAQIHYFKLQMVENLSLLFTGIISKIILITLSLFAILLGSMALSFYLSTVFSSNAIGFLLGSLVFVLLIVVFLMIRKLLIDRPIIESFMRMFYPENPKYDKDE